MQTTFETTSKDPLPQIDIIMPTHDHLELTMDAVDALYSYTKAPFHLVVVDDSTDGITPYYFELLKKKLSNITFLHTDTPYKCGNQFFNVALKECHAEYVVTVMNSVCVEPDWEIVALRFMKENPKTGTLGFKCLHPNGHIEGAGIAMNMFIPCDIGRDQPGHRLTYFYECDAVAWAFALHRREAIMDVLPEGIYVGFRGWDDIDNCFVLRKNGWGIYYCGHGVGYHKAHATRGSNSKESAIESQVNAEIFWKRWGFWEKYSKFKEEAVDLDAITKAAEAELTNIAKVKIDQVR